MQLLNIGELQPHSRNSEFFDDIGGESWDAFIESIKTSGVIEPIIITQNKVIVSGHQRVRACRQLGIEEVMTETRQYDTEDQIVKDLIETNLRQRGIGNPNPVKFGRCIKELERIYGIRKGSAGRVASETSGGVSLDGNNCCPKNTPEDSAECSPKDPGTEREFADRLGISVSTLRNYKRLAELIPEVEDFLVTGMITPTTALAISHQLSKDDQAEFMSQLDKETHYTANEINKRINSVNSDVVNEDDAAGKVDDTDDEIGTAATTNATTTAATTNPTVNELQVTIENLRQQLFDAKTDNNRIRFTMDKTEQSVDNSSKIIDAISRTKTVIDDQILPLLHNDDLNGLDGFLMEKSDEFFDYVINIMKECKTQLHTGQYISAENKDIIDM